MCDNNGVRLFRAIGLPRLKYRTARRRYQLLLLLILLLLLVTAIFLLIFLIPTFKTCPDVPAWLAATQSGSESIFVSTDPSDWAVAEGSGNILITDHALECANSSSCYAHHTIPVNFGIDKYLFSSVSMYRKGERGREGLDGVYYDMYTDLVRVGIRCLDASQSRQLCHFATTTADINGWATYWMSGLAPADTAYLRVEVEVLFLAGDVNDGKVLLGSGFEIHVRDTVVPPEVSIVKQPSLYGVLQHSMCVMWETDSNLAKSVVRWKKGSEDDAYSSDYHGFDFEASPMTQQLDFCHYLHSACMMGLEAHTTYNYYVSTGSAKSLVFFFTTALPPGSHEHFDMAVIADNQNGDSNFRKNVRHLGPRDVDFVVHVGDMVQGSDLKNWHYQYFSPLEIEDLGQKRPFLFVRGNHDAETALTYAYTPTPHFTANMAQAGSRSDADVTSFLGTQNEFLTKQQHPIANSFSGNTMDDPLALHPPFYSFIYGNADFIVLDTNADVMTSPQQYDFLKQKLSLTNNCQKGGFLLVFLHACPYTNLWDKKSSYNGDQWIRENFVQLFEEYCVDLVISGHTHAYQRGRMSPESKVTYVVNGGGGGALDTAHPEGWEGTWPYEVTTSEHHYSIVGFKGCRLVWRVYSLNDNIIDEFVIDKCPTNN